MQAIPLPQVHSRHSRPAPSLVPSVVRCYRLHPEVPDALVAFLAETDVDEEITELVLGLEVRRRRLGGPSVDAAGEEAGAVPAAEGAGAFGFVVEGSAEGDDAFDLR